MLEGGTAQEGRGPHGSQLMSWPLDSRVNTKTCSFSELDRGGTNFTLIRISISTNHGVLSLRPALCSWVINIIPMAQITKLRCLKTYAKRTPSRPSPPHFCRH